MNSAKKKVPYTKKELRAIKARLLRLAKSIWRKAQAYRLKEVQYRLKARAWVTASRNTFVLYKKVGTSQETDAWRKADTAWLNAADLNWKPMRTHVGRRVNTEMETTNTQHSPLIERLRAAAPKRDPAGKTVTEQALDYHFDKLRHDGIACERHREPSGITGKFNGEPFMVYVMCMKEPGSGVVVGLVVTRYKGQDRHDKPPLSVLKGARQAGESVG